jgi:hypothetical protein
MLRPAYLPLLLAALVGLAFTPPGRAVTGELGELVGIGEVGGPPSQPSRVGHFDPASRQVVLAVGEAADGPAFEIVAFRAKQDAGGRGDAICVNVEWLDFPSDQSGSCYSGALNYGAMCCAYPLFPPDEPPKIAPTEVPWVEGEVSPEVSRVSVSYVDDAGEQQTVEATLGMITPEIAERLDIEHPSGLFFASVPGLERQTGFPPGVNYDAPAHPVVMSAFNADGELLESETTRPVSAERIVRMERQEARLVTFDDFRDLCIPKLRELGDPPIVIALDGQTPEIEGLGEPATVITPEDMTPECQRLLEASH